MRLPILFVISVSASGCGSTASPITDGPPGAADAPPGTIDAPPGTIDASPGQGFTIVHQFDGDAGTGPTGRGKPEMNAAASGTQVTQVTWQHLNVYDYTGTLLKSTTLTNVVLGAGLDPTTGPGVPFEPHVIFDEFIQRWIITTTCLHDCVIVSDGPDATTTSWKGFYLDGNGADPAIHLAYDRNGVYFTETVLTNPNPDTPCCSSNVFAIPGVELQWTTTLNPAHRNKRIGKPHEIMPVVDHDPGKPAGAAELFVARVCPVGNSCQGNSSNPIINHAFRWIVSSGTWSGTTFTMTSNHTGVCTGGSAPADQCLRTDPDGVHDRWLYNTPIDPDQPGTTMKLRGAESHRINDAMQQEGGHVHVVTGSGPCVSGCGAHGHDVGGDIFIWADLDCSDPISCTVSQTAKVSVAEHLIWTTIGVDPSGNVGVFANVAGPTTHLGIQAWSHHATDAPGVMTGPNTVIAGTTPYTCSLGSNNTAQTGNPAGIATVRDPLDPTTLWVSEQYARDSGDCHWNTRIVQYRP